MKKSCKELIAEYDEAMTALSTIMRESLNQKDSLGDFETKIAKAHARVSPLFIALKESNCRRNRRV